MFSTQNDRDLLFGTDKYIAAYLGVSPKTVARWKAGATPLPETARRLLKLRYGDLAGLLDSSWQGFAFHQGELFHPDFKQGFSADEARGWFFGRQELAALRKENAALRVEIAQAKMERIKAQVDTWAADKLRGLLTPTHSNCAASAPPAYPPAPPPSGMPANKQR